MCVLKSEYNLFMKMAANTKSCQLKEQKETYKNTEAQTFFLSSLVHTIMVNTLHVIAGCSSPGCQSTVCKWCGRLGARAAPRYLRGSGDRGLSHQNNLQERNQLHDSLQRGGDQKGHHGGEECVLRCIQRYGALWYVSPHSWSFNTDEYLLYYIYIQFYAHIKNHQQNVQREKLYAGIQLVGDFWPCAQINKNSMKWSMCNV